MIVSAVAAFAVGAVWYSPLLFAKQWMQVHGHTPEKLAANLYSDLPIKAFLIDASYQLVYFILMGAIRRLALNAGGRAARVARPLCAWSLRFCHKLI